jgi:hypothetical protein
MKKFKVVDNRWDAKPPLYVTLYNPPYENKNILYKTGLNEKDVTITDVTEKFQGEE